MKPRSPQSMQLYKMLLSRGYPESFCDLVTKNLNTDFTASRMIGYLCHYSDLPPEEIADEMLSILSDRNRIMQKKELDEAFVRVGRSYLVNLHYVRRIGKTELILNTGENLPVPRGSYKKLNEAFIKYF